MTAAVATLVIGIILGFLGQRSRMCSVGAIRDFILVRDTYLLKGFIAFGLTAWFAFSVAGYVAGEPTGGSANSDATAVMITILAGVGFGFVSTLANGCPFRQHVLAAQGVTSSITYLLGFFVGVGIFHAWTSSLVLRIFE